MAITKPRSDYEIRGIGFKFEEDTEHVVAECIGSCEETMNTRIITKKCRGIVKKKIVRPDGTGVVKISLHIPWDIYAKVFGMDNETVKDGIKTYGINNKHGVFSMTADVFDEDDNEKLKAYPNCVVETGKAVKIENGAEEVAEMELEVAVSPDDYGNGLYEALVEELTDATLKSDWMTKFTPDMAQKAA